MWSTGPRNSLPNRPRASCAGWCPFSHRGESPPVMKQRNNQHNAILNNLLPMRILVWSTRPCDSSPGCPPSIMCRLVLLLPQKELLPVMKTTQQPTPYNIQQPVTNLCERYNGVFQMNLELVTLSPQPSRHWPGNHVWILNHL